MRHPLSVASLACLALLSACGGNGDNPTDVPVASPAAPLAPAAPAAPMAPVVTPPVSSPPPSTVSGTVAVGAPISGGTLRILDANGAVVAADVPIGIDGSYPAVALSGPAPYRMEACGQAGPNYTCLYSVATGAGTANVTPLTTAAVLLAAGQAPGAMMTGAAPGLTDASVATAQTQLRSGLAAVLASAGIGSDFDFVSGPLAAGSRSGYDGVLDAVGVALGQDTNAFVQITPRLGTGNLYLEQGSSNGSVTSAVSAATLQLSGLEALFLNLSDALASAASCSSQTTGLRRSLAANAQLSLGGPLVQGPADVAQAMCGLFAEGEDGSTPMWGSRLLSPTLGRCDLTGTSPVCGVSFVLQTPEGDVQSLGGGMAVAQESGVWKFMGDLLPIEIHASAKAQRTQRIDGTIPALHYDRALAFEVAAVPGLECAKVSQKDATDTVVTIGYYKRHLPATDQRRLALWTNDGFGNGASTDPAAGATRSGDDTWITLAQGAAGDNMIRNFYRGGRSVNVALYADRACSSPFIVGGKSVFDVEVEGVPPVWSAMEALPWPVVDASSQAALRALALPAGADGSLRVTWAFDRGPLGLHGATVCASRADCGQGGTGRLGERSLRPSARDATVVLKNNGMEVGNDSQKTLALFGRTGDSVDLQSNYSSCPQSAVGEACH